MKIDLKIKRDGSRGYVVIRVNGSQDQHAHVRSKNGARFLINFINRGIEPKNKYLQGSCRRLLTDEEYSSLKRVKQRYYNRR